jgi:hypothetical protein
MRRPAHVKIFLLDLSVMVVADQREAPQAFRCLSFLGKVLVFPRRLALLPFAL